MASALMTSALMASPGVTGARLTGSAVFALVTGRGPDSRSMDCVGVDTCSDPGIGTPCGLGPDRLPPSPRNHDELADDPDAMACGARELRLLSARRWLAEFRFVDCSVGVPMVGRGSS